MSDNDLIRRGEVREFLQQCGLMGNHPSDPLAVMFNEIAAAQPTVSPDVAALVEIGNEMAKSIRGNYYPPGIAGKWEAALARVKGVM